MSFSRFKCIHTHGETENCCQLYLYYFYTDWCFVAQIYTPSTKCDLFVPFNSPKCTSLATSWIFCYCLMLAGCDIWALGNWALLSENHQMNTLETLRVAQYPIWLWLSLKYKDIILPVLIAAYVSTDYHDFESHRYLLRVDALLSVVALSH